MYDRQQLIDLVRTHSLKFGDFTLASGKKASYYLDGKQVTLDSQGAMLVGEGILELLLAMPTPPTAIGGMSIGADPITAAVITMAAVRGAASSDTLSSGEKKCSALKGFMVRKQSKGHGTNRFIEGPVTAADRVVIVEDVVTTGGSSLEAIERVIEAGITVLGVIAVIDRMEGGKAAFAARGYSLQSLLTIQDFGITPPISA